MAKVERNRQETSLLSDRMVFGTYGLALFSYFSL